MSFSNKGMNSRNFLKVGGMSTVALTLGTTGLFSPLTNATKGLAAEATGNPTSGFDGYGPVVSNKLAAFAEDQGISPLEAAALERHGMPII